MLTTPIADLPYPELTDLPNGPSAFSDLATALDSVVVPRFTNATSRSINITSPVAGQICYLTTEARFERFTGSAWRPINHTEVGSLSVSFSSVASASRAITFNGHTFVNPPVVVGNINSLLGPTARWVVRAESITTTGCNLFIFAADNVAGTWSGVQVQWCATGV